jgi:DNA-binding beta-propeller fold protein YncE
MKKSLTIALTLTVLFALKLQSQVEQPLKLIQSVPLPGLHDGDFDHFAVDPAGQWLFLAAEDDSAVEVIDLRTNKLVRTIRGPEKPHSMAYRTDLKRLFVVDGDEQAGEVRIYTSDSYEPAGSIKLAANADSSTYDPATKYMYVVSGGRGAHMSESFISVIDTSSAKKLADITIDSDSVQAMAFEKSGPRMFANLVGKSGVAVIDREKRTVMATWFIGQEGKENTAMAFDEANHRLFVFARDPGKLIVLDSDSGKIVTTLPCVGQTDDAVYDPASKRLYVAGVPFVYVFEERNPNFYKLLGEIPTAFHAVTATLVPELHQFYLAVPHHGDAEAKVQIYEIVR